MNKYAIREIAIPQEQRADINNKILHLITNGLVEKTVITPEDIYNSYTGDGGLHGLQRTDFDNYHDYSEAKKEIEQGQFFTPPKLCQYVIDCLRPTNRDIIYDLTCGMGSFFNFLPEERNIYGADIDIRALKVAKFLYPQAHLEHEDIRNYQGTVQADYVVGNPPFHLSWHYDNERIPSHLFYCLKAKNILKPGGLLAIVMPESFLSDPYSQQKQFNQINDLYDFIIQVDLPDTSFKHLGISSFSTKLMVFQRKSIHLPTRPYTMTKETQTDAMYLHETYIRPVKELRDRIKSKLRLEMGSCRKPSKIFSDRVTKLLYDISRNPKTAAHLGRCESLVHAFLTQKQPEKVSWKEWEKMRIKEADVTTELQKVLSNINRVYRNECRIIKTRHAFLERNYKEDGEDRFIGVINDVVLDKDYVVEGYERLIKRKRREYNNQSQEFDKMSQDARIQAFLDDWVIYSNSEQRLIQLNEIQQFDVNKLLQKRYGILQYEMGSGKTLCGLAMSAYHLKYSYVRNVFVVADALAINNTWEIVMDDYEIPFYRIDTRADIEAIPENCIVLITLSIVMKYRRELKHFMRSCSNKALLIFDESDAISNPTSVRAKSILSIFRRCKYKYLTTGTMTRNNIIEAAPQLELLYNNSINYISWASYIHRTDADGNKKDVYNSFYGQPIPAYTEGYQLFSQSHLPHKVTVFGVEQFTQDVYNADVLKEILNKTVITRTFEEVSGRKIYDVNQVMVPFQQAEKTVYATAIKEFHTMRWNYFNKMNDSRKDSMFRILQQLILLLKICADPASMVEYTSEQRSSKISKLLEMLAEWGDERVAIGVRHIEIAHAYAKYIKEAFPERPLFVITGGVASFKKRRQVVEELEQTPNSILLSTQQAYSKSQNIDFVDKIILPELHYNNAAMSQYYFRFIRYTSTNYKKVYFLTYEHSIESNLIRMIMAKEKLNLFMKSQNVADEELFERFGVDQDLINMLMTKETDEDGHVQIRWGEQKIASFSA